MLPFSLILAVDAVMGGSRICSVAEYDEMFIAWPVDLFNKLGYSGKSGC